MTSAQRPRIAIADKNQVIRDGLTALVGKDGRFEVAGAVSTGQAFIAFTEQHHVDVGIIGWSLTDMTGGDVLAALKQRQSSTRIIVYTGEAASLVLRPAIKAGAWGFVSKGDESSVLIETVATVSNGRLCFPYVDIQTLTEDPLQALTIRERELLAALANGWSNLQIASRIGISRNTVKYHLKNLYDKLGVKNRAMAVGLFMSMTGGREHR